MKTLIEAAEAHMIFVLRIKNGEVEEFPFEVEVTKNRIGDLSVHGFRNLGDALQFISDLNKKREAYS